MLPSSGRGASRRRYVAAALATGAVVAYVAHRQGYLKRRGKWPLLEALSSYRQALVTGGAVASKLASDLQAFIDSDAEEIPASLRQLLRLAQSEEAQRATEVLSSAACRGAVSGALSSATEAATASGISPDTFFISALEAAASERGRGLISILVATVARQAVEASLEANRASRLDASAEPSVAGQSLMEVLPQALAIADSEQGSRVLCGASPVMPPFFDALVMVPSVPSSRLPLIEFITTLDSPAQTSWRRSPAGQWRRISPTRKMWRSATASCGR